MKTIYASTISSKQRKTLQTMAVLHHSKKNSKAYKTNLDYIFRIT